MMLRTTYSVIPAQSLPRTRSPSVIPAEAGIHACLFCGWQHRRGWLRNPCQSRKHHE